MTKDIIIITIITIQSYSSCNKKINKIAVYRMRVKKKTVYALCIYKSPKLDRANWTSLTLVWTNVRERF